MTRTSRKPGGPPAPLNGHFTRPRRLGKLPDPDGVGSFADPEGEDAFTVYLKIKDGRIADVRCDARGCRCARAAASALAELALGKTLDEALRLRNDDVFAALGGTPDPADPRPNLGADALHRAVFDYLQRLAPSAGLTFWTQAVGLVTRVAEVSDDVPPGFPRLAEIGIFPRFEAALHGIEGATHVWVLWWMHELADEARTALRAHPRGDPAQPEKGVFALRSPARPNPIGLGLARLVERQGGRLLVDGLDARPGSPVLDLKPWSERDRKE